MTTRSWRAVTILLVETTHLLLRSLEPLLLENEGLAKALHLPLPDMSVKLLRCLIAHPVILERGQPSRQSFGQGRGLKHERGDRQAQHGEKTRSKNR